MRWNVYFDYTMYLISSLLHTIAIFNSSAGRIADMWIGSDLQGVVEEDIQKDKITLSMVKRFDTDSPPN